MTVEGATLKLDFNTREALCFIGGFFGVLSQTVLYYLGFEVNLALLGAFLTMMGLPVVFSLDEKRRNGGGNGA